MYTPCWNVEKNSRLPSMDKKKEWVENILQLGARTKFEIYKGEKLGNRIDNALYAVIYDLRLMFSWFCYERSIKVYLLV